MKKSKTPEALEPTEKRTRGQQETPEKHLPQEESEVLEPVAKKPKREKRPPKEEPAPPLTPLAELKNSEAFQWLRENPDHPIAKQILLVGENIDADTARAQASLPQINCIPINISGEETSQSCARYKRKLKEFAAEVIVLNPPESAVEILKKHRGFFEILTEKIARWRQEHQQSLDKLDADKAALGSALGFIQSDFSHKDRVSAINTIKTLADRYKVDHETTLTLDAAKALADLVRAAMDAQAPALLSEQQKFNTLSEVPKSVIDALFNPVIPLLPDNAEFSDAHSQGQNTDLVSRLIDLMLPEDQRKGWKTDLEAASRSIATMEVILQQNQQPNPLKQFLNDNELYDETNKEQQIRLLKRYITHVYKQETPEATTQALSDIRCTDEGEEPSSMKEDFWAFFGGLNIKVSDQETTYADVLTRAELLMLMTTLERASQYEEAVKDPKTKENANAIASDSHRLDLLEETLNDAKKCKNEPNIRSAVQRYAGLSPDLANTLLKDHTLPSLIHPNPQEDSHELQLHKLRVCGLVMDKEDEAQEMQAAKLQASEKKGGSDDSNAQEPTPTVTISTPPLNVTTNLSPNRV